MRNLLIPIACISLCIATSTFAAERRPNVVLIFADDQGTVDLNCYGAKDLITPHLDGLAKRGIRFTQFYAAAPVCSPSRAGLLTGRYPQRAGVPGNVSSQKGNDGMPASQITIAEMMKRAGYVTGHVGKWHLGYTPKTMPNGQGFDESFGHMGGCIDNYSHFFYWNGPNRHDLWRNGKEVWADGKFFPDLMVQDCSRFITKHKDKPFFLYWAINVPHYPLQGTDKWRKKYTNLKDPRRKYAAFVSTMDEKIGEVLATLDRLKLRDDTIIIYQSDHGHSTEVRTFGGGRKRGTVPRGEVQSVRGRHPRPRNRLLAGAHCEERSPQSTRHRLRLDAHHRRPLRHADSEAQDRRQRPHAHLEVKDRTVAAQGLPLADRPGTESTVGRPRRQLETDRQPARHQQHRPAEIVPTSCSW